MTSGFQQSPAISGNRTFGGEVRLTICIRSWGFQDGIKCDPEGKFCSVCEDWKNVWSLGLSFLVECSSRVMLRTPAWKKIASIAAGAAIGEEQNWC